MIITFLLPFLLAGLQVANAEPQRGGGLLGLDLPLLGGNAAGGLGFNGGFRGGNEPFRGGNEGGRNGFRGGVGSTFEGPPRQEPEPARPFPCNQDNCLRALERFKQRLCDTCPRYERGNVRGNPPEFIPRECNSSRISSACRCLTESAEPADPRPTEAPPAQPKPTQAPPPAQPKPTQAPPPAQPKPSQAPPAQSPSAPRGSGAPKGTGSPKGSGQPPASQGAAPPAQSPRPASNQAPPPAAQTSAAPPPPAANSPAPTPAASASASASASAGAQATDSNGNPLAFNQENTPLFQGSQVFTPDPSGYVPSKKVRAVPTPM